MALAIVTTLEAREADRLDLAARTKHVTAITGFLSENRSALAEQMRAEGFDPSKMRLAAEKWYPAIDGLTAVRGLMEFVSANLNNFKQPNPILRELKAAESLLTAAAVADVKFHFTKVNV